MTHADADQLAALHGLSKQLNLQVEANIGSNLSAGSLAAESDHPLLLMLLHDVPVTLNTDSRVVSRVAMGGGRHAEPESDRDGHPIAEPPAWLERGREGPGRIELSEVWLKATVLHYRQLQFARFEDVELFYVVLEGGKLEGAEFTRCRLDHTILMYATFERSVWTQCDFLTGRLGASCGVGARFMDCSLPEAELERSDWSDALLERVQLTGANLQLMKLHRTVLRDCDLTNADLTDASLAGARFERCVLAGATLPPSVNKAELTDCS